MDSIPNEGTFYEADIEFIRELIRLNKPYSVMRARFMALYACSASTFARRHRDAVNSMRQEIAQIKKERELEVINGKPAMNYLERRYLLQQIADGTMESEREVVMRGEIQIIRQRPTIREQLAAIAELNRMSNSKEAIALNKDAEFKRCLSHLPMDELKMLRQLLIKARMVENMRKGVDNASIHAAFYQDHLDTSGEDIEEDEEEMSESEMAELMNGQDLEGILKASSKQLKKPSMANELEFSAIMKEIQNGGWELFEMAQLKQVGDPDTGEPGRKVA
jgi:hypothetical protein